MEEKKQPKIIFAVLGVAILLTLTVGLSFAIFTYNGTGGTNTISTGTISMSFTESTNVITLTNALPVQNSSLAESSTTYFEFTVTSVTSSAMTVPYKLTINKLANDTDYDALDLGSVQVYLTEVSSTGTETAKVNKTASAILNNASSAELLSASHVHTTGNTMSTKYRLRLWIPYSVDASKWNTADDKYMFKIRIDASGTM